MPVTLYPLERFVLISLNPGPAPLSDIVGGFAFHVIVAALRLDLFEALRRQPLTICPPALLALSFPSPAPSPPS